MGSPDLAEKLGGSSAHLLASAAPDPNLIVAMKKSGMTWHDTIAHKVGMLKEATSLEKCDSLVRVTDY